MPEALRMTQSMLPLESSHGEMQHETVSAGGCCGPGIMAWQVLLPAGLPEGCEDEEAFLEWLTTAPGQARQAQRRLIIRQEGTAWSDPFMLRMGEHAAGIPPNPPAWLACLHTKLKKSPMQGLASLHKCLSKRRHRPIHCLRKAVCSFLFFLIQVRVLVSV